MSEAKFYAVFFDVAKPQNRNNALVVKVEKKKFANLLNEAVPDKKVELKFNDGAVANYTIKSRQNFWTNDFNIVDGQDQKCFIICNVEKIKCSPLSVWLNEQRGLEKVNNLFYRFWFNEKWCVGQVTITPDFEELTIKPNLNTHDIGNGEGVPVYKKFKR